MKTLGLLILLCCLPSLAKTHQMETAKVISQDISSREGGIAMMPMGTGLVGVPINRHSNVVVVQAENERMTWVEVGNNSIILPVNGSVNFYRDNKWFIVLDAKSKKHKFSMIHMESIK